MNRRSFIAALPASIAAAPKVVEAMATPKPKLDLMEFFKLNREIMKRREERRQREFVNIFLYGTPVSQ